MLVVMPVCHREVKQANKLIDWIGELGGCGSHEVLFAVNKMLVAKEEHIPMLERLSKIFRSSKLYEVSPEDERPGPPQMPHVYAANNFFIRVNKDVINDHSDTPYLWLESDAIPLVPDWLDRIQTEYFACGKPFMGARVLYENTPEHMSGVAVYRAIGRNAPDYVMAQNNAWDVVAASQILPKAHFTGLIQHDWKAAPFNSQADMARIRSGVVIYHQCKDLSLIDRLRESRGGVVVTRSAHHGEIAGVNPAPATVPDVSALLARIAELEAKVVKPPVIVPPVKVDVAKSNRRKAKLDTRTPEQKQAAKDRMAKARAGRKPKAKA